MTSAARCSVCGEGVSRYKCPACCITYCSVVCYKKHKDSSCLSLHSGHKTCVQPEKTCNDSVEYEFETEDTVPIGKLNMLRTDPGMISVLQNPHLRTIMTALYSADDPAEAISELMKEPIFVEFVDHCLSVIESA